LTPQRKHPETVYRGERIEGPKGEYRGVKVTVDGKPLAYPAELPRVSPGVEWGYRGAGARQLALALILDATGDAMLAKRSYRFFCHAAVEQWGSSWRITAGRIFEWLEQYEKELVIDFPAPDDDDADAAGMPHVVGPKLAVNRPQASRFEKGGYR